MPLNRALITRAGIIALVALAMVGAEHTVFGQSPLPRVLLLVGAGIAGIAAIRQLVDGVFGAIRDQRLLLWRNLASWSMYALLVLIVASELGVDVSGFLLGGAILGVVVASASQAPLGNFFAGLILLTARPFSVGDTVRVRTSLTGGAEYEGTVVDARAFYTTLVTADGQLLRMPNSAVLSAVLVVGGALLQAELELELPEGAQIAPVKHRLEERLPAGSVLELRPRSVDVAAKRTLCEVRVRCPRSIPAHDLADLVLEAAAPD